jgi:undecaprenyl-diphosphatase
VAWTRIVLGVHYLSDVVGGLALGAAVVLVWMAVFGLYPGGSAELSGRGRVTGQSGPAEPAG